MAEMTYRTNARIIEVARSQMEELRRNPSNDPEYDEARIEHKKHLIQFHEREALELTARMRAQRSSRTNNPDASASASRASNPNASASALRAPNPNASASASRAPNRRVPSPPSRSRTPSPVVALRRLFGDAEPVPIRPDPNASASTPAPALAPAAYRERGGASADDDIEYDPELPPWADAHYPESPDFKPEVEDIPGETDSHGEDANEYKPDVEDALSENKPDNEEGNELDKYGNAGLTPYDSDYADEFKPNVEEESTADGEEKQRDGTLVGALGDRGHEDTAGGELHSPTPFEERELFWDEEPRARRRDQPVSPGFEPPRSSLSGPRGSPTPMLYDEASQSFGISPAFSWNNLSGARGHATRPTAHITPHSHRSPGNPNMFTPRDANASWPVLFPENHSPFAGPLTNSGGLYSPRAPSPSPPSISAAESSPYAEASSDASPHYSPSSPSLNSPSFVPTEDTASRNYTLSSPNYEFTIPSPNYSPSSPNYSESARDEPSLPNSGPSPSPPNWERDSPTPPSASMRSFRPTELYRPHLPSFDLPPNPMRSSVRSRSRLLTSALPAAFSNNHSSRSSSRSSSPTLTRSSRNSGGSPYDPSSPTVPPTSP